MNSQQLLAASQSRLQMRNLRAVIAVAAAVGSLAISKTPRKIMMVIRDMRMSVGIARVAQIPIVLRKMILSLLLLS